MLLLLLLLCRRHPAEIEKKKKLLNLARSRTAVDEINTKQIIREPQEKRKQKSVFDIKFLTFLYSIGCVVRENLTAGEKK